MSGSDFDFMAEHDETELWIGDRPMAGRNGPMGPWALAHWARGPWHIGQWALAHGPWPIGPWALAHWPTGPGPLGPWALAHWGLRGTKNIDFSKSLGMASPGVENVGVPRGSVFKLSRASQLPYSEKSKKSSTKKMTFPVFLYIQLLLSWPVAALILDSGLE